MKTTPRMVRLPGQTTGILITGAAQGTITTTTTTTDLSNSRTILDSLTSAATPGIPQAVPASTPVAIVELAGVDFAYSVVDRSGFDQPTDVIDSQLGSEYNSYSELSEIEKYYFKRIQSTFEKYWHSNEYYLNFLAAYSEDRTWVERAAAGEPVSATYGGPQTFAQDSYLDEDDEFLKLYCWDDNYFSQIPWANYREIGEYLKIVSIDQDANTHTVNCSRDEDFNTKWRLYHRNYYDVDDSGIRRTRSLETGTASTAQIENEADGGQFYFLGQSYAGYELCDLDWHTQSEFKGGSADLGYDFFIKSKYGYGDVPGEYGVPKERAYSYDLSLYFRTLGVPAKIEIREPRGLSIIKSITLDSSTPTKRIQIDNITCLWDWFTIFMFDSHGKIVAKHTVHLEETWGKNLVADTVSADQAEDGSSVIFEINVDPADFFVAESNLKELDPFAVDEEGERYATPTADKWKDNTHKLYFLHIDEYHDGQLIESNRFLLNGGKPADSSSNQFDLLALEGGYQNLDFKGIYDPSLGKIQRATYNRRSIRGDGHNVVCYRFSKISIAAEFGWRFGTDGAYIKNMYHIPITYNPMMMEPRTLTTIRYPWLEYHPSNDFKIPAPALDGSAGMYDLVLKYSTSRDYGKIVKEMPTVVSDWSASTDTTTVSIEQKKFYITAGDDTYTDWSSPTYSPMPGTIAYEQVEVKKIFTVPYANIQINLSTELQDRGAYGLIMGMAMAPINAPGSSDYMGNPWGDTGDYPFENKEIVLGAFACTSNTIYFSDFIYPSFMRWSGILSVFSGGDPTAMATTINGGLPDRWEDVNLQYKIKIFAYNEGSGDNWWEVGTEPIWTWQDDTKLIGEVIYDPTTMPSQNPRGWQSDALLTEKLEMKLEEFRSHAEGSALSAGSPVPVSTTPPSVSFSAQGIDIQEGFEPTTDRIID
ncbi:MAG: hypothetical protein CBC29_05705 [Methylococcaceae bacterium TMED69]|nr:MAG: hypothetical protein CBC29_05705 [Methylococcaceae bacterium TMED69]